MTDTPGSLDPEREWVHQPIAPGDFSMPSSHEIAMLNQQRKRRRGMMRGFLRYGTLVGEELEAEKRKMEL